MQDGQFQPKLLEMCKATSNWEEKIYNGKYQLTLITVLLSALPHNHLLTYRVQNL